MWILSDVGWAGVTLRLRWMIAMRNSALLLIEAKRKNQKSLGYPKGPRRVTRGNLGPACTPHTMQNLVFASWALARLGPISWAVLPS